MTRSDTVVDVDDVDASKTMMGNYKAAGEREGKEYKAVGGMVDYYSAMGPVWLDYILEPRLASPAGHTLATWPLETSMAKPYICASYALVKSRFLELSVTEILALLQTTARPVRWVLGEIMLSVPRYSRAPGSSVPTMQLHHSTYINPGQMTISDVTRETCTAPVFGGYIKITSSEGPELHVP
ncbi:hypothetical protein PG994_013373 [Apiospora phragmitis]|uniref:Uncharacterized protein n=1 Tax=Apiospora phragmitis TaxID=2905665 RepID=A0ABR1TA81_9PEZI